MKRVAMAVALAVVAAALSLGCCPKENSAKTATCKTSKTSDECKTCCGGNYSFGGEGSCSCY